MTTPATYSPDIGRKFAIWSISCTLAALVLIVVCVSIQDTRCDHWNGRWAHAVEARPVEGADTMIGLVNDLPGQCQVRSHSLDYMFWKVLS